MAKKKDEPGNGGITPDLPVYGEDSNLIQVQEDDDCNDESKDDK